jgi:K+/H+ antiporter YhaU regulatory subunit KhtT
MVALATVLVVVIVSLLVARVATVALVLTGLSHDAARFQARSALSGTGFTTGEAESVVAHPVRRRVIMVLMLVGSAGLVTVIATLMLSFTDTAGEQKAERLAILVAGLTALWFLARSPRVDRILSWAIARVLHRWTDLDTSDYGQLLHLAEAYAVGELAVQEGDWVADRTLGELRLRDEGVVVLGITLADGAWLAAPTFETRIHAGERLVLYGAGRRLRELDRRAAGPEGDRAHEEAVADHRETVSAVEREHVEGLG